MDPLFWDCEYISPDYIYKRKPKKKKKSQLPAPVNHINIVIRQDKKQHEHESVSKTKTENVVEPAEVRSKDFEQLFDKVLQEIQSIKTVPKVEATPVSVSPLVTVDLKPMETALEKLAEQVKKTPTPVTPTEPEIDAALIENLIAQFQKEPAPAPVPVTVEGDELKQQKRYLAAQKDLQLVLEDTMLIAEGLPKACREKAAQLGVNEMPAQVYAAAKDLIYEQLPVFFAKYDMSSDYAAKFVEFQERAREIMRTICPAYIEEKASKTPPYVSEEWMENFVVNKLNI